MERDVFEVVPGPPYSSLSTKAIKFLVSTFDGLPKARVLEVTGGAIGCYERLVKTYHELSPAGKAESTPLYAEFLAKRLETVRAIEGILGTG